MWLSYILPLYNCGKYISECLDSILMQGLAYEEYEVIIVNDGSTDNGPKIVDTYCCKYPNFHLITKKNEGVSSARNCGFEEAKGDYVYFMDADDWLVYGGMRILRDNYLASNYNPDILDFNWYIVDKYYERAKSEEITHSYKLVFYGTFWEYENQYMVYFSVCNKLISRNLLLEHNMAFKPYKLGEDCLYILQLLSRAKDAIIIKTNLNIYRYRIREYSATTNIDNEHIAQGVNALIDIFLETKTIVETTPFVKNCAKRMVAYFQRKVFFNLCSSSLSLSRMKCMLSKAYDTGFYPIYVPKSFLQELTNYLCRRPLALYLFAIPYRYIFLSWIKPYIKRT